MQEPSPSSTNDMLCDKYKKREIVFKYYRGFELYQLKQLLDYSFSGFVMKIDKNHKELRFDIHLSRVHSENNTQINLVEVERFKSYWGRGFNLIFWSPSDDRENE